MSLVRFRALAEILGVGFLTRDSSGNISLSDAEGAVGLGKGAPVAITGSRDLTDADDGVVLVNKGASNYTLTVPAGLRAGFSCTIIQGSTGTVALAAGASAEIANASSYTKTGGAGAKLELKAWDTDKYSFSGDGAA